MKSVFSRLFSLLFIIALSFACSEESPKPQLTPKQVLDKAAKARKTSISDDAIYGSWKVSSVHDQNWNATTSGNNACYANVVWNLNSAWLGGASWQVLNFSGNSCGTSTTCQAMSIPFSDWMVNSGYSNNKHFYPYKNDGDDTNRAYFEEISDCSSRRDFPATWTIVDNYYLVIYPMYGGAIILTRN